MCFLLVDGLLCKVSNIQNVNYMYFSWAVSFWTGFVVNFFIFFL